jgi:L-rhamnose mutarotase
MKRFAQTVNVKKGKMNEYKKAHLQVWPEVLKQISQSNIKNYSIFVFQDILFSYFEYHGVDYESDMAKMASDPITQNWWALMEPLIEEGDWWLDIEEVFHLD